MNREAIAGPLFEYTQKLEKLGNSTAKVDMSEIARVSGLTYALLSCVQRAKFSD